MRCPHCGTESPARANYCFSCGAILRAGSDDHPRHPADRHGATIGASHIPDAFRRLMPDQFVEKLMSSKGRVEGERRVVTILFCDVKGSTALAESLDPEDVMGIMNGAFEEMIAPVVRYGGTLARLMGDGILAFFGAPVAHEDDPARACRAGLDILDGIRAFAEDLAKERGLKGFNVRVGINTGLVVVGEVGNALRVEYTAMGDAVNLAARMETSAEPGTVRVTEATWRLVHRLFESEPLGEVEVKGKSAPVRAYRITGITSHAAAHHRGEGLYSPFVGRRAESRLIGRLAADLAKGKSSVIAVIGEPGVGKSRLIAEAEGANPGIGWMRCRAVPYGVRIGDSMARHLLCSLIGAPPDAEPEMLDEALRHTLASAVPEASGEFYPYLARLMNIPSGQAQEALFRTHDAETFRGRSADALRALISAMAADRPLALVWEDLHWADPSSMDLLGGLLDALEPSPVLFLLVSRPESDTFAEIFVKAAARYGGRCRRIEMKSLARTESRLLLSNILAKRSLPPAARREILEKTGGNPFFIEEVLRSMIDSGGLGPDRVPRRDGNAVVVPETITGVITARMDCLGDTHRDVLHTSSVIGRNFRSLVLALTLEMGTDDARLTEALVELTRREFIERRPGISGGGAGPDADPEYCFRHGITQDVVYGSLLLAQRRMLHRRVGESIEKLHPLLRPDLAATLALHFDKAGIAAKAFDYTVDAAAHAKRSYAGPEAILHYTRALSLAGAAGIDAARLTAIHESLGEVCALLSRYPEAIAHFDAALSNGAQPASKAVVLRKRARVYEQWGRYAEADADLQSALGELIAGRDAAEEARVRTGLARVCFRRGDFDAAASLGEAALAVMDLARDAVGTAEACNILGNIYARKGDIPKAVSCYDRCRLLWEELGHQGGLAVTYNNLGQVYHQLERWDDAILHYLRSLGLSERIGDRYGTARTCDNLSQVYAELGKQEEAMKCLKRAVDIFRDIGREGSTVVPEMWVQSGTL